MGMQVQTAGQEEKRSFEVLKVNFHGTGAKLIP